MWSYFDDIVCINLKDRTDRYEKSRIMFDKIGIPIRYYQPERHPISGQQGCFESHVNIIREAWNKGCQNLLIFEDDAILSPYYSDQAIEECIEFMGEKNTDYNLFYFGSYSMGYAPKRISGNIYTSHSLCAHAYVISRKMMEKIKDMTYIGVAIDLIYVHIDNCYAYHPTLFYQDNSPSDISSRFWNIGFLQETGIKTFGMRAIEIMNVNMGMTTNSLLIALIVGIILFIILAIVGITNRWMVLLLLLLITSIMFGIIVFLGQN